MRDTEVLAMELQQAVLRHELFPVFQPQFSIDTGTCVAVEGLCRWQHPARGIIAPDLFIPLAEESGAIHAVGRFMLDACLDAAESWHESGVAIEVAVNVSPLQLASEAYVDVLVGELGARALPAEVLTLEITETGPVADLVELAPRLEALRDIGFGISLDDFSIGSSSRERMDRLPLTEIKLDRSLVQDGRASAVREKDSVVALAHERQLRVVAEGIETPSHLVIARTLGCDRVQGYLLGRPTDKAGIDRLLAA